MRRLNKSAIFMVSVIMVGSMAIMSGCGASDGQTENIVEEQTVKEENSTSVAEGIKEDAQSAETETETQTNAETEIKNETKNDIKSETETETEIKDGTKTDIKSETETETQTETEIKDETKNDIKSETETNTEKATQTEAMTNTEEQHPAVQEVVPAAEGSVAESDYAVIVKGVTIPLKGDMRNYTALLGEPDAFGSAKSCTEAGEDKVYTYGGTIIYTYITNGADIISLIEITGSETLISGIHIGSTKADVIAAYGSSYTQDGSELLYEVGNKTLGIQMNREMVSFIELF